MKIIKIIIGVLLIFSFCGCTAFRLGGIGKSSDSLKYQSSNNYRKEYYNNKEKGITYYEIEKANEKKIPKMSFAQKIGAWIGSLGTVTVILVIVGMFLAPTVTISIIFGALKRVRRAFVETVKAIKESQAVNENEALHNALKSQQSVTTKKMVGEIKSEL